ncbi:hypothetical protein E4U54_006671 [Claviceps lovelessii]|nr:hypothetical protein E4U54_006671 [Claviceps lovelessii]
MFGFPDNMDHSADPFQTVDVQRAISQSTEETIADAEIRSRTGSHHAQQEELVPELRILEVMRSFRPEKEDGTMEAMDPSEPSSEAQENQEPTVVTLPPQDDAGAGETEQISAPSNNVGTRESHESHESPEAESATMPVRPEPRLKKSRKRAYQKLEEEAEEILKGWTPTGNAGFSTRGTLEKPSQKKPEGVKALKKFKSNGKPGRPRKTPSTPGEPLVPPTTSKTSQAKVSASKPSRRGRPRGRATAAGGALGTKRATNTAPLSKETEVATKQDKARSSTSAQTGRVTKTASRGGRGRGRPRKRLS